ncbi:Uncharacterized protein APZ42_026419 [Daphnia magna]|uniref:Uncharacterized protein n=1 Tax=Daphnia magna TaxID=35525 RepID=A0A0P6DXS7_9CRUS|nr:Uncharacterized protein APZ42_026419 [Daphnia magna]
MFASQRAAVVDQNLLQFCFSWRTRGFYILAITPSSLITDYTQLPRSARSRLCCFEHISTILSFPSPK